MPRKRLHRIAILLREDSFYIRGVLEGIKDYARPVKPWVFHLFPPDVASIDRVQVWQPHGIITHLHLPEFEAAVCSLSVPVVNVGHVMEETRVSWVATDDQLVGELAARHFLDRGFRSFGFTGFADLAFSVGRERAFVEYLRKSGIGCSVCDEVSSFAQGHSAQPFWTTQEKKLARWLKGLPRPAAVMCCNDYRGLQVSEVCREAGLRVPEDVALIGVDDDRLICELAYPPLSSVAIPAARVGYEAAGMLDRLMDGLPLAPEPVLIPPIGVVGRQSSDLLAIDDLEIRQAVQYIRGHADSPLSVEEVLRHVPVSRRSLERRFLRVLGRSPLQEIRRVKIDRAKVLLAGTDLAMPIIAQRSGLSSAKLLSSLLHSATGLTPTQWRRQFRIS
jgi:LacI family transcriptional regulator